MGLDGPEGPPGLDGDLVEAQIAEEPQGDDLAIRLIEPGDRGPDLGGPLGAEGRHGGIRPTGQLTRTRRSGRIDPGDVAAALHAAERDPDADPPEPRPDRPVAPPPRESPDPGPD